MTEAEMVQLGEYFILAFGLGFVSGVLFGVLSRFVDTIIR
jgi:hypothetical protein